MSHRWWESARSSLKIIVGEEVEDVGLGTDALRVRSQHLRGSGKYAQEKGHLGPRHAIREAGV